MTNILIVEDDPMVQFIHRNYLEKIGTFDTIYSSETIAEAKKLLSSRSIQLVLLDIRLKDEGRFALGKLFAFTNHEAGNEWIFDQQGQAICKFLLGF